MGVWGTGHLVLPCLSYALGVQQSMAIGDWPGAVLLFLAPNAMVQSGNPFTAAVVCRVLQVQPVV